MATLKETVIEGDFRAEDLVIDINDEIGNAQDPGFWFGQRGGIAGVRVNRGSETDAVLSWDEDDGHWEVGLEGGQRRILDSQDLEDILNAAGIEPGDNVTTGVNASTGATIINAVPSGSDGELQYNDSGSFGAFSGLTFDGASLTTPGITITSTQRVSGADELLVRDAGTGEVRSILPQDLDEGGKTYTATTSGAETQVATFDGSARSYSPGTAVNFEINVAAQVSFVTSASLTGAAAGDTHTFRIEGSAVHRAGSLSLVGTPDVVSVSYDVPVNDLSASVATSGNELQVQVTGTAGTDVDWAANVQDTVIDIS